MTKIKTVILTGLFALSTNFLLATEPATCLEKAISQTDMNECAGINYHMADGELNRVYAAIQSRYGEDKLFLQKLKEAQLAWINLRDADFAMQFPHAKDSSYYGKMFPTCADGYKTALTLQRIAFLKQWLIGVEEGDSCTGSKQFAMNNTLDEKDEIEEVCYAADSLELRLNVNYGNGVVQGSYDYLPAEKDQRLGKVDGSLWKGAISAKYTFEQEGQKDTANVRIELGDKEAVIKGEEKDKALGLDATLQKIDCGA